MSATSLPYPSTPASVDPRILEPSPQFRKEAGKVLAAILLFIVTYLVLVVAALALAVLCALGGLGLIVLKPMFITFMVGAGLAGLGIMVVIFLVKFIFKRHKIDRSALLEVREKDHPRLFAFIRKLAAETQTPFPKRIYLSPDVNASVFYDSGFWSMFLPVRKNLQIGLALVNAVNLSEFKAIVAHEFGHFSQRSMKLGSYVYNVNRVIYNLLFDNEGYEGMIQGWANTSGYFAFFAMITVRIVQGIQWVLQQVYTLINRLNMSLSRQMEFHADAVSASVSGGNHLVTSLRRLEVANTAYSNMFGFYQQNFEKSMKPDNIFPQHTEVMRQFAKFHELPIEHGLPQVNAQSFARFQKTRVVLKDQWASHPSDDDREQHLRSLKVETEPCHDSPWTLFDNVDQLQQEITAKIFGEVQFKGPVQVVNASSFRSGFQESLDRYSLPEIYKGFFDSRAITKVDVNALDTTAVQHIETLDELLTDAVLALPYLKNGLTSDLQTLAAVASGKVSVKSFDFDGKRNNAENAVPVMGWLQEDLDKTELSLAEADKRIIGWFLFMAGKSGTREQLVHQYRELFSVADQTDSDAAIFNSMQESLAPLYQPMPADAIESAVAKLKVHEVMYRERLQHLINDPANGSLITDEQRASLSKYLAKQWTYFRAEMYHHEALGLLGESLQVFAMLISERAFQSRARVLRSQLELAGLSEVVA